MSYGGYVADDAISANLSDTKCIGDSGAKELALHPTLTSLNLMDNDIGDDGAIALALNTTLTKLDLWDNEIGNAGAKALSANTTLTWLDVGRNRINTEGAKALALNTTLISLNMSDNAKLLGNHIKDEGFRALALNTTLISLELWASNITTEGIRALSLNSTLTSLDLENCRVGDEGARALSLNTTLTSLLVSDSQISSERWITLDLQLKANKQRLHERRNQFIRCLIILARDTNNRESGSSWNRLIPDMRRYIVDHVCCEWQLGISQQRARECASYITKNITQIDEALRKGIPLKIVQKDDKITLK